MGRKKSGDTGEPGRAGEPRRWVVGGDRIELSPSGRTWTARVFRGDWDGLAFDLGGIFPTEEEGVAWCEKMARALARDRRDDPADPAD